MFETPVLHVSDSAVGECLLSVSAYPLVYQNVVTNRVCAGRHFALNQLYSTVACVLHSFSITPALDVDGNPIPVEPQMSNGIVS